MLQSLGGLVWALALTAVVLKTVSKEESDSASDPGTAAAGLYWLWPICHCICCWPCHGCTPSTIKYRQAEMRSHLKKCLQEGTFTRFPHDRICDAGRPETVTVILLTLCLLVSVYNHAQNVIMYQLKLTNRKNWALHLHWFRKQLMDPHYFIPIIYRKDLV